MHTLYLLCTHKAKKLRYYFEGNFVRLIYLEPSYSKDKNIFIYRSRNVFFKGEENFVTESKHFKINN